VAKTYLVINSSPSATPTAAPVKQPTGNAIRTMMQLVPATGFSLRVVVWGCSFDASVAATPGEIELCDTGTVLATALSTAYAAADIMPHNDPNALANSAGTSGIPLNLGTGLSGFSTAAVTEGSITVIRELDAQLVAPTGQYVKQFPLGREPEVTQGHSLRVRMTFAATVNAYCYIIFEV
jgi:hypothetical protein